MNSTPVSPDGKLLAVPDKDKLHLYDLATGAELRQVDAEGLSRAGSTFVFSNDSKSVVVVAARAEIGPPSGPAFALDGLEKRRARRCATLLQCPAQHFTREESTPCPGLRQSSR